MSYKFSHVLVPSTLILLSDHVVEVTWPLVIMSSNILDLTWVMSYNILDMIKWVMSYYKLIFLFWINKYSITPLISLIIQQKSPQTRRWNIEMSSSGVPKGTTSWTVVSHTVWSSRDCCVSSSVRSSCSLMMFGSPPGPPTLRGSADPSTVPCRIGGS